MSSFLCTRCAACMCEDCRRLSMSRYASETTVERVTSEFYSYGTVQDGYVIYGPEGNQVSPWELVERLNESVINWSGDDVQETD